MERNDLSFSIPTWRHQQIKSISLAEQQALYMTSPYNLNDFKNTHHTIEHIFLPNQLPSEINSYASRREMNARIPKEIAIFSIFIYEIILGDSDVHFNSEKALNTEKRVESNEGSEQMLGLFKQKILQLNMCKVKDIPKQFQIYYRNQIIKKILFQYFGKCIYNISLIELLLLNNDFLRFCVEICVKSVLFEGTLIKSYNDPVDFNEASRMFLNYFGYLFLASRGSMTKSKQLFSYESNLLKAEHYLLRKDSEKIYLYKRQFKHSQQAIATQKIISKKEKGKSNGEVSKSSKFTKSKFTPFIKQKAKQQAQDSGEKEQKEQKRKPKSNFFSCLPCFRQR